MTVYIVVKVSGVTAQTRNEYEVQIKNNMASHTKFFSPSQHETLPAARLACKALNDNRYQYQCAWVILGCEWIDVNKQAKIVSCTDARYELEMTNELSNQLVYIDECEVRISPKISLNERACAQAFASPGSVSVDKSIELQSKNSSNTKEAQPELEPQPSLMCTFKSFFSQYNQPLSAAKTDLDRLLDKFKKYAENQKNPQRHSAATTLSVRLYNTWRLYKQNQDSVDLKALRQIIEKEKSNFTEHNGSLNFRKPRGERRLDEILKQVQNIEQIVETVENPSGLQPI